MLFDYQELDIVGKNSSVKKLSELGSEKRSCYNLFECHLMNLHKPTHNQHTNPTNQPTPYISTLNLNTYPTYLHYLYKPTKPYIHTLETLDGRHHNQ